MVEVRSEDIAEISVPEVPEQRETKEEKARRESREQLELIKAQHTRAEAAYDYAIAKAEKAQVEARETMSALHRALEVRQRCAEALIKAVEQRLVKGTITT